MNTLSHLHFFMLFTFGAVSCGVFAGESRDYGAERSNESVEDAYALEIVQPKYPLSMLERGIEGQTLLKFQVSEMGEVHDIQVVATSNDAFSEEAVRSVKQWFFEPGKRDGVAISQTVMVPVRFLIDGLSGSGYASL